MYLSKLQLHRPFPHVQADLTSTYELFETLGG